MRVLVLGASGMIGSAMFRVLSESESLSVMGTVRTASAASYFSGNLARNLVAGVDAENGDALLRVFERVRPNVVVNCIGITKHHRESEDPRLAIPLNALLPHKLADICSLVGSRLLHVSTDCVFSGDKGAYTEDDGADARDIYGKAKFLGEVNYPHAVTLRTSTIGHELQSRFGLLEWFLAQGSQCEGFSRAIFSGLPSTEFARVVRDVVIPMPKLSGLYNVGGKPIAKYDLLQLIAKQYGKNIDVLRSDVFSVDRSLDGTRFYQATGYVAPDWPELISAMHANK